MELEGLAIFDRRQHSWINQWCKCALHAGPGCRGIHEGIFERPFLCGGELGLAMERRLIIETGANNPAIGYNLTPRWLG